MKTGLAFRAAEQHVRFFEQEASVVIAEHPSAMDRFDCEAFLQMGIDAYQWLIRADAAIRRAYANGEKEFDEELDAAFQELAKLWLGPCLQADEWATEQLQRGYAIDNLEAFRKCCSEMRAIVDFYGQDPASAELPPALSLMRDQALTDYANGETSEFV
jgi:hypothetical protein